MWQRGKVWIFIVITLALLMLVWFGLGSALLPLIAAFFGAYLFFPVVQRLERLGVRRDLSAVAVIALTLILATGAVLYLVPLILDEGTQFITSLPETVGKGVAAIERVAAAFGYTVEINRDFIITLLKKQLSHLSLGNVASATGLVGKTFGSVLGTLIGLLNLFLFPVFFFYILHSYDRILDGTRECVPQRYRERIDAFTARADRILSGYIRGQILVCLSLAVLYAVGLQMIGLQFGFIIGILAGLLNIIPYVGFTVGIISALLTALASNGGWPLYLGIVAVFSVVQGLEGFVITPRVVGDKVGLGALSTMIALIVGGNLLGMLGMIIAIPTAAILLTVLGELHGFYRCSRFYKA